MPSPSDSLPTSPVTSPGETPRWRRSPLIALFFVLLPLVTLPNAFQNWQHARTTAEAQLWGLLTIVMAVSQAAVIAMLPATYAKPVLEIEPGELRFSGTRISLRDVAAVEWTSATYMGLRLHSGEVRGVSLLGISKRRRQEAAAAVKRAIETYGR